MTKPFAFISPLLLLVLPQLAACSDEGADDGAGGLGGVSSGGISIDPGSGAGNATGGGGDASGGGSGGPWMLPAGFERADLGGWKVGDEVVDSDSGDGGEPVESGETGGKDGCGTEIIGVVRDFRRGDEKGGHPDFETYTGQGEKGIVLDQLGEDGKPVHAPGDHEFTTSEADFNQWYRTEEGVNRAYLTTFSLEPNGGVSTFKSSNFFPLDGLGFGNEGEDHNFHFTTEIHTEFVYQGGETFTFTGDDDLWVFINDQLAIDLGGLHSEQTDTVALDDIADEFGLEKGEVYPLDLFHAERHTDESNFRIDTTLQFTSCNVLVDDVVVR